LILISKNKTTNLTLFGGRNNFLTLEIACFANLEWPFKSHQTECAFTIGEVGWGARKFSQNRGFGFPQL
jgi:hypothetical protein